GSRRARRSRGGTPTAAERRPPGLVAERAPERRGDSEAPGRRRVGCPPRPTGRLVARYPRGLTQVSDQARQAVELVRSPRISGEGVPAAKRPFSSICADWAGKNVLKTPRGRSLKPGGAWRTNGSSVSYQVSTTSSS